MVADVEGSPPSRPNILFIMTDQLRRDALGVYGSWAPTPNLDALAAESTIFDNAITNAPACQPARHALARGWYPHNFGLWTNGMVDVPPDTPTWMATIRDAGYRTSVFGKLHLAQGGRDLRSQEDHIRSLGYDVVNEVGGPRSCLRTTSHMVAAWEEAGVLDAFRRDLAERLAAEHPVARPSPLPLDLYYDSWVPDRAAEHLRDLPADEPWFCTVSFTGPHEPWDAPEPYASMFSPADAPPAYPREPANEGPRSHLDRRKRQAEHLSPALIADLRANYAGSVALIDDKVGELLSLVRSRGEWDRTVVVVTADHGELNGDHGMIEKGAVFDSAISIPLLVRIPGVTEGARSAVPVELLDVGPTLADAAGAEIEHQQFGRSLVPNCVDPAAPGRQIAVCEYLREYLVFDGRHKLVVNARGRSSVLWDALEDPAEQRNLLGTEGAGPIARRLRDRLLRFHVRHQVAAERPGGGRRQREAARALLAEAD